MRDFIGKIKCMILYGVESAKEYVIWLGRHMAELLYPARCPLCGKLWNGVCPECVSELTYISAPFCMKCGKPVEAAEEEYCGDCRKISHIYTRGRGMLLYGGKVKESIHKIKYQNKREYLEFYGNEMAERLGEEIRRWEPEVLIPIPMFRRKQRKRGYNQSEILAVKLGKQLGIPVCTDALKKICDTRDQKELSHRQRRENLKHAFSTVEHLPFQRVLLVDDVYTTGSTIDAAAKALRRSGVRKIFFVTVCVGEGE